MYKSIFGSEAGHIGVTLDTSEIGLGIFYTHYLKGWTIDIALFALHIYITS